MTRMSISYDPDETPRSPDELHAFAREMRQHVIAVNCEEHAKTPVGENSGVSFMAMSPFLPHPGDRIVLEDGKTVQVTRSYFRVANMNGIIGLVPTVNAVLCQ